VRRGQERRPAAAADEDREEARDSILAEVDGAVRGAGVQGERGGAVAGEQLEGGWSYQAIPFINVLLF